jgi:hypothetical protein
VGSSCLRVAALLFVLGVPGLSAAQERDPLDTAFAEMIMRPEDPAAAVRYARLAAARGDARGAITALERVLRGDPSLDNIRLELASLHLANGSPAIAATYAREVLASPSLPPHLRPRAELLATRAERAASSSALDVTLFAGLRYDTNANEATTLGTVPIFVPAIQDIALVPAPNRGRSDWSGVFGLRAAHRQDLGLQREGAWETNASVFAQYFARIPRAYDLSIATVDTGPRIGVVEFGDGAAALALRPFATLSWIGYGGATYGLLYGGGLTAELRLPDRWTAEATLLGRFGNYENSSFRPTARGYTGAEWSVTGALTRAVGQATRLSAFATYIEADARESYFSRQGVLLGLAAQTAVMVTESYEVGLAARGGWRRLQFDSPDPFLDPTRSRRDTRWEAGASVILPVTTTIAVAVDYEWFDQRSTYAVYRYDNHAVMVALRINL